jgi:hypothetical protein
MELTRMGNLLVDQMVENREPISGGGVERVSTRSSLVRRRAVESNIREQNIFTDIN